MSKIFEDIFRQNGLLPAQSTPKPAPAPKTTDKLEGFKQSGTELVGNLLGGVSRLSDWAGEQVAEPVGMLHPEAAKKIKRAFSQDTLKNEEVKLKNFAKSIGYAPEVSLEELQDDPTKYMTFLAERLVTSAPHMVGSVVAPVPMLVAMTNDIYSKRIANNGGKPGTYKDVSIAMAAAAASVFGERYATLGGAKALKSILPGGKGARPKSAIGEASKVVGVQTATEAGQSAIEELGATVGTEKGVDTKQVQRAAIEGALVGGGLGAGVGAVSGTGTALQNRAIAKAKEAEAATEPTPEATAQPTPEAEPIQQIGRAHV